MATIEEIPETPSTTLRRKHYIIHEGDTLESLTLPKNSTYSSWNNQLNHIPTSQIWPLTYGPFISGILAATTGSYFTRHLRYALVLQELGSKSTYIFAAGVPAITAAGFHFMGISSSLLENGITDCPICLQVRGGVIQLLVGGLYAAALAPVTLYPILHRMKKSFRAPSLTKSPRDVLHYFNTLLKPVHRYILPIMIAQTIAGMGLTYLEQEAYITNVIPIIQRQMNPDSTQNISDGR